MNATNPRGRTSSWSVIPLRMATWQRHREGHPVERGELIGHADAGQYTSKALAELSAKLGVTQSMGAIGSSADNALAESFNATFKRELLQGDTT